MNESKRKAGCHPATWLWLRLRRISIFLKGLSLAPGIRIAERYELLRSLGQGGMGTVFLAYDRRLHRRVAIKPRADGWTRLPCFHPLSHFTARSLLAVLTRTGAMH